MIQLGLPDGGQREVYVSPQGKVLGSLDPHRRIEDVVSRIHGSLLLGPAGDRIVELAASWTIMLILSGLYLWWPRPFRAAGTLWPRLSLRGLIDRLSRRATGDVRDALESGPLMLTK